MSREIERHVELVMRRDSRKGRREALATVPAHLRERVRAEVEHRWRQRKGKE